MFVSNNEFNILSHINQLIPAKEKGKYICPACEGNNLSINKNGKYNCWNCNDTQKIKDILIANKPQPPKKSPRQKKTTHYDYPDRKGNPLIRVVRSDDGKGNKKIFQQHWDGQKWVKGYGSISTQDIPLYRYSEVIEGIANGQQIILAEGESTVDAFWEKDIPATTTIGGTGKSLKDLKPALADLAAASVILAPDCDKSGCKYMEMVSEILNVSGWLYAFPNSYQWQNLPEKGGLDFVDWIQDYPRLSKEEILNQITKQPKHNLKEEVSQDLEILVNEEIIEKANRIIQFPLQESRKIIEINTLSRKSQISPTEARRIVEAAEWEDDFKADLIDSEADFKKIIAPVEIDLEEIFPAPLAKSLLSKAESDRIDPIRILQTLLPMIGTMLGAKARIILKKGTTLKDDWAEYPIFYTTDIAPPSSGKSAIQRGLSVPIQDLQRAEFERVKEAKRELVNIEDRWKELSREEKNDKRDSTENPRIFEDKYCKARRYLFDQITIQALQKKLAEQPKLSGSCWFKDELSGLFKSLDQFTNGKGDAMEFLLSAWNGPQFGIVDRVDESKSYQFNGQCLNIAGGIQPLMTSKIWNSNEDPNGLLSRFLPAVAKIPSNFSEWSDVQVDIYEILKKYLDNLEKIDDVSLSLSPQAHEIYKKYWSILGCVYEEHLDKNPAYAYFIGKQKSYVGRFALVIHILDCISSDLPINSEINIDTIKKAIKLSKFYCHQFRKLQASSSISGEIKLDEALYLIVQEAEKRKGKITTREISNRIRAFKKMNYQGKKINAAIAMQMIEAIANAGYGHVEGKTLILNQNDTVTQNDTALTQPSNTYEVKDDTDFDTGDTVTQKQNEDSLIAEIPEASMETHISKKLPQNDTVTPSDTSDSSEKSDFHNLKVGDVSINQISQVIKQDQPVLDFQTIAIAIQRETQRLRMTPKELENTLLSHYGAKELGLVRDSQLLKFLNWLQGLEKKSALIECNRTLDES
ncbi:MAG: DUF3987 domain-containing protein [Limnoraphis robusta]